MAQTLTGIAILGGYYLCAVMIILAVYIIAHRMQKQTREWFRKLLHAVQFSSVIPLTYGFDNWLAPFVSGLAMLVIILVILIVWQKIKPGQFGSIINERRPGEGFRSFIMSFGTIAVIIAVCWEILHSAAFL